MPEISVIIPVYNTERYLADCLTSVLAQTFRDFEAIIVDDGSTDGCAGIISEFAGRDSRIVTLRQENKGLSEARNAGINIAKGNWITFVDSDDKIAPDFLHALLDAAKACNADIACSGKRLFKSDTEEAEKTPTAPQPASPAIKLSPEKALAYALYQKGGPDYSAWSKLYSAKIWKSRRFTPGIFFEDMDCIPQAFLDAERTAFVPEPLYLNRRHDTSILATAYDRKKAELLDIAEKICTTVQGKGDELERAAACNLFSASCSILMRTPDTDEFADYRDRAWKNILETRKAVRSPRARLRNKVAAFCTLGGRAFFCAVLRRFG